MLITAELDMADSVTSDEVDVFLDNAAWAIRSTYHTSEVESKTILMGHPISCCHALVVRSFFINCKVIISP